MYVLGCVCVCEREIEKERVCANEYVCVCVFVGSRGRKLCLHQAIDQNVRHQVLANIVFYFIPPSLAERFN